ncbi:Xre family transcriptional regulator [Secundilactobacillus oryzae JCM 18671]|uniref:Xre family transcriptional regulator n=1 Tax=Secundilactobacillus oryzae JCM 18671 TaxID=1291743 RepID=A0A081BI85_9LACO|nr:hypothetical protein [Secundilactobacillus oryzae]GAK47753.1 Xre family transcriptional regulator [Secundilactobacillus oryzae JCM 18671]
MSETIVYRSFAVNSTLPKVMKLNHKTATAVGKGMNYTQSFISKLAHGDSNLQFEQIKSLLEQFPDQSELLVLDICHHLSGGLIPPVADGEAIKSDSEAIGRRAVRELSQAIDALAKAEDEFDTNASAVHDTTDPKEAVWQIWDAIFIGINAAICICHEYDYSLQDLALKRLKVWKKYRLIRGD